jgi:glycosyltransferase involved in cell wall biosynthesis
MKRILFIADHRPDRSPGQRYRFEQYFDVLQRHGFQCTLSYVLNAEDDRIFYRPGNYLRKAFIVAKSFWVRWCDWKKRSDYDIIFIFRNCVLTGSLYFEKKWVGSGKPIVFDFDDAIWKNDTSAANRMFGWLKRPEKINYTLQHSRIILAGNAYLAKYASQFNSNVMVIPTTIDMDQYQVNLSTPKKDQIVIGWTGSITTIKHFVWARPSLLEIKKKYGNKVRFVVIGDEQFIDRELDIQGQKWYAATEAQDLCEVDIGIMPLPDDEWTQGKCGLKGLQYMALGIPPVLSPVGVNKTIIQHGVNGLLACQMEDWTAALSLLIEDGELRRRLGEQARNTVSTYYSKASWENAYVEVFDQLTKLDKS